MIGAMDDAGLGRRFRALRHRLGWRQQDVGDRAGISQDVVSLAELGRVEDVSIRALRRHARALGAELHLELWFRGAELDRLLDEGHAVLVGAVASRLASLGWEVRPEVSFAVYGERGSIDLVAWHAASRTLLVIEVKTELASLEETLRRHDAKARLAAGVVAERFGWRPVVSRASWCYPMGRRRVARSGGTTPCCARPTRCGVPRFGHGCGPRRDRSRASHSCRLRPPIV